MTIASGVQAPDMAAWPPLPPHCAAAGHALVQWVATADTDRSRLCVLRGGRASGKSHLLAWFLIGAASHPSTTAHATVPAQGLITDAVAWEMGRQLGYGPVPAHRLLVRIAADQRPLLLLLPDLHLAGRGPAGQPAASPQAILGNLLLPLLALPHVRVIAETGESGLLADQEHDVVDLGPSPFPGAAPPADGAPDFVALRGSVPATPDGRPIWAQASRPVREGILDAALEEQDGKAISSLLADPGFLIHGSAAAITAALRTPEIAAPTGLRPIWERAAPQLSSIEHDDVTRAALLQAAALGTSPALSEYLRPLAKQHVWTATWAQHGLPVSAQCQIPGNDAPLVTADPLGRLSTHNSGTGQRNGTLSSPTGIRPAGIAAADRGALLVLDEDGPLHVLASDDEDTAATVLGNIADHHGQTLLGAGNLTPTALGSCPQSPLAAVGDSSGAVHVWSLTTYQPAPRSRRLHSVPVSAVACTQDASEGMTFVFSSGFDGTIRLWETSQEPMDSPIDQRPAVVTALAAAITAAGPVLAAAWNDGELHLWHISSGKAEVLPLLYRCSALALSAGGQLMVGGPDGMYAVQLRLDRLSN
ncbi:hypothetical protein [Streptomyces sp. WAC 06725]|uniref:hypothetical protein n=1 Tax=Streptomyces sp. WAC 06725 TaxID=2203209 RepID=UPI0021AD5095|nr:hypothetical protein [Streptomyces sp. WAC 06725]